MKAENIEGLINVMNASIHKYVTEHTDTTLADVVSATENVKQIEVMRVIYGDVETGRLAKKNGFLVI